MMLVTADIHLNNEPRDAYRHRFMVETLPALVKKHKAKHLVILGDLTDEKNYHGSELVNKTVDYIARLSELCKIIILRGNHDYEVAETPFFMFTGHLDNVRWVNRPALIEGHLFLPHTNNYKRDWKDLDFKNKVVFCHQTFTGANIGPRQLEGIPTNIFPATTQVFSGDIHVPQHFANITYVGAPYTIDFGDDYQPRLLLLDSRRGEAISIPCPGPQKRLVAVRNVAELAKVRTGAEGDIVKVVIDVSTAEHPRWKEIQNQVREWATGRNLHLHLVKPNIIDHDRTISTSRRGLDSKSDEELMKQYAIARAINERTLKVGMELL